MALSEYAWAFLGTSVAEVAGCITAITVAHIKTSRQLAAAKAEVKEVRKLAEPTGNGFANDVRQALLRIETKVDDHIAAHADRDLRGRK